jgi:hypothetical protein
MFRNRPSTCVCKTDQRFVYLIQDELDALERGDTVSLACIKDPDPQRVDHWRISLMYYEARYAEALQAQQQAEKEQSTPATKQSKHITFEVSLEDHALLHELHKKTKIIHGDSLFFSDFVAILLSRQLEVVKLLYPTETSIPF